MNNTEQSGFQQYFRTSMVVRVGEKKYFVLIFFYWNLSSTFPRKFHKLQWYHILHGIHSATESDSTSSKAGSEFVDTQNNALTSDRAASASSHSMQEDFSTSTPLKFGFKYCKPQKLSRNFKCLISTILALYRYILYTLIYKILCSYKQIFCIHNFNFKEIYLFIRFSVSII